MGRIVSAAGLHQQKLGYQHNTVRPGQLGSSPGLLLDISNFLFHYKTVLKMDINVNLNINLDLSERMVRLLRQNMPEDLPEHCCDDFDKRVSDICLGIIKQLSKHAHPEENSGKAEEPAPQAPVAPAPAPAPEKTSGTQEITDADLRLAVKAAKDKVGTDGVKALFHEFEIPNSSACPQERRSELMDRLNKLAA